MQFYAIRKLMLFTLQLATVLCSNLLTHTDKNSYKSSTSAIFLRGGNKLLISYIVKPILFNTNIENGKYIYTYCLEGQYRNILKNPNKLEYIMFNNKKLIFDDDAKLPKLYNWPLFDVYSCKGYGPLLIRFHGPYGYGFYSLDTKTGKWNNQRIDGLKDLEVQDDNGFISYRLDTDENIDKVYHELTRELSKLSGKYCITKKFSNNALENPLFEIYLTQTEDKDNIGNHIGLVRSNN